MDEPRNKTYTRCTLNESLWGKALKRLESACVFDGSHRKEQANEVGILGEVVAEAWFNRHDIRFSDQRESTKFDYIVRNQFTLDVKTKDRTVIPKIYYDNSVPLYNHEHQRPDYYLFISLLRNTEIDPFSIYRFTHAYIVGAIDLPTLDCTGRKWNKGETDTSNGTTFWTSCINIPMSNLISAKDIISIWGPQGNPDP